MCGGNRIRGELLKLESPSAHAPSAATDAADQPDRPAGAGAPSSPTTRRPFGRLISSWSRPLYVLSLISHDRRRLLHFNVTGHPTAAWVWRQMIEATPWGQHPKYLIHDRDRAYGADFATRIAGLGIESVRTPVRAPRANAIGERVVRTLRRECLDHILPLSERHSRAVLAEYASYYNQDCPPPIPGTEGPGPEPPAGRRGGGSWAGPRRLAPRLRTSRLTTTLSRVAGGSFTPRPSQSEVGSRRGTSRPFSVSPFPNRA